MSSVLDTYSTFAMSEKDYLANNLPVLPLSLSYVVLSCTDVDIESQVVVLRKLQTSLHVLCRGCVYNIGRQVSQRRVSLIQSGDGPRSLMVE
jgi:hypothetical protein